MTHCATHNRLLTYYEVNAGGCFWCDPSLIPDLPPPPKGKGKVQDAARRAWERREKRWAMIRILTPEQRDALRYGPLRRSYDDSDDISDSLDASDSSEGLGL